MLVIKVIASTLLMASIPIWIRLVEASSLVIGVARLSIALALTLVVFGRRLALRAALRDGRGTRWVLIAIGLLFGAHWYTYFEAIQRSSASLGLLALCTFGIHVTWMGAVFSTRRPTRHDWLGVLLSAAGAWVALPAPEVDRGAFVGFLFGLLSAVFYAILPLLHQRIAQVPHATRAAGQFLFAWLLLLPSAPFQHWQLTGQTWLLLAVLGVFCTFVAHNLWIAITTEVRPATSGMLYYLTIPVTMALEAWLLARPPLPAQWLGAGLVLTGNAYALWFRRQAT